MRQLAEGARARWKNFVEQNAWVPLVGKAMAIAVSLVMLAAIGAGHLDGAIDLGPARAEAATTRRAAPAGSATLRPSASASAAAGKATAPSKIILNEASATELEKLPGVGPAKAQAIVALRDKLGGRFKRFEDLLRVRGIKRKALLKIREHALLDPPPADAPPQDASPSPSASAHSAAPRSW